MSGVDWHKAVEQAAHYLAVGQAELYLDSQQALDTYPWEWAARVRTGGTHRLDIDTNVWFMAEHPSGLTFSWSFDLEPYSANGKGSYEIDADACRRVLALLPLAVRGAFRTYLADCAGKVAAKAVEWRGITERQERDARVLQELASTETAA